MLEQSLSEVFSRFPKNQAIQEMVFKTLDHIENEAMHDGKIMISVSGGSDSDIMIDLFERIGYKKGLVLYVWYDTGLEYDATKRHLEDVQKKYGIEIKHIRAKVGVAKATKKFGVPFLNKRVSNIMERLQKHNFDFGDKGFEEYYKEFPHCKAALRFWCNKWGDKSAFNIQKEIGLKDYIMENAPPTISDKCCTYAKKNVSNWAIKQFGCTLNVYGVRRSEGGQGQRLINLALQKKLIRKLLNFARCFILQTKTNKNIKSFAELLIPTAMKCGGSREQDVRVVHLAQDLNKS